MNKKVLVYTNMPGQDLIEIKFLKQQCRSAKRIIDNYTDPKIISVARKLIDINTELINKLHTETIRFLKEKNKLDK